MHADLEPRAGRPGTSLPQGAAWGPASPRPPAVGRDDRHVVERYRRAVDPTVRGIAGVVAAVAFFAAAGAVGRPRRVHRRGHARRGLSWYRVTAAAVTFVVILAAGYGLEHLVAARTGRRALPGREGEHAQDR